MKENIAHDKLVNRITNTKITFCKFSQDLRAFKNFLN